MRRLPIMLVAGCLLVTAGCRDAPARERAGESGNDAPLAADAPPAADSPLPTSARNLADSLASTTRDLEARIRDWQRSDPPIGAKPPAEVTLDALFQQRIYRHLRRHPSLANRVIAAMPARLRMQARDNVGAGRSLLELAPKKPPKTQPPIKVGTAEAPGRLLAWYRQAQKRFGVRWEILASVNLVESGYNRLRNNSYAGAQGPMQFMPATWRSYGLGGNVRDPHDAIMGAANYLRASGAASSYRNALYHYNPSSLYVDAIIRYARQMQRKPERFYAYWSWQVFIRDKRGNDVRLTGPGLASRASSARGSAS